MVAPLVSVLLPVYNSGETLGRTMETLAAQSLDDFEIVAVDDGSEDGSGEILRAWAGREPRLRPVPEPHRGLVETLNRGIGLCRGRFIARMDADDLAHPQRLEKQAQVLFKDPRVGVVGSLVEMFPRDQVGEGFRQYQTWLNSLVSHEEIAREIFVESPIVHPSAMVRRQELIDLGGYREFGWAEDYDLWLRYFSAGRRFAKVPEVLLQWREHPGRLTRTDGRYSLENFIRAKVHYLFEGPLARCGGLVVWGAGQWGRRLSKHLIRGGLTPAAFVDIDPKKIGGTLRGQPVISVDDLPGVWSGLERPLLLVAVPARGARQLIRQALAPLGFKEGEHFLCVA